MVVKWKVVFDGVEEVRNKNAEIIENIKTELESDEEIVDTWWTRLVPDVSDDIQPGGSRTYNDEGTGYFLVKESEEEDDEVEEELYKLLRAPDAMNDPEVINFLESE